MSGLRNRYTLCVDEPRKQSEDKISRISLEQGLEQSKRAMFKLQIASIKPWRFDPPRLPFKNTSSQYFSPSHLDSEQISKSNLSDIIADILVVHKVRIFNISSSRHNRRIRLGKVTG